MKDTPKIVCPVCGQTYLASEIYLPHEFFGKPGEIIKNTSGKIDFFTGKDMDLDEEYICDNCGAKMKIHANVSFDVEVRDSNFTEEYSSKINKADRVSLEEGSIF